MRRQISTQVPIILQHSGPVVLCWTYHKRLTNIDQQVHAYCTGPMIWKSLEVGIMCYCAAWKSVEEAVKGKVESCVVARICEVITENGAGYCENCHYSRKQMRPTVWSPKPTLFLITKSPHKLCDHCNDWTERKCMGTCMEKVHIIVIFLHIRSK